MTSKKATKKSLPAKPKGKKRGVKLIIAKKKGMFANLATDNVIDLTDDDAGSKESEDHNVATTSNDSATPAKPPPCKPDDTPFHKLPGELRNRIYNLSLLKTVRMELPTLGEPALAIAIPDFRDEVYSIVLSANHLEVPIYTTFKCQESDSTFGRADTRGEKFGAGNFSVPAESWLWNVDSNVFKIRNIGLRIEEMGGFPLGDFFINVTKVKTAKGDKSSKIAKFGRVVKNPDGDLWEVNTMFKTQTVFTSKYTRRAMTPMVELARERAKKLAARAGPGFNGFSWEDVQQIAKAFAGLERAEEKIWRPTVTGPDGKKKKAVRCLLEDEEIFTDDDAE